LGLFKDHKEALKRAELVRDIELDLYWRRAAYFWAFSAAAFAGYFALASAETPNSSLLAIASCLGTIFSWVWYLANRGGKYWQLNWEQHIDLLEDEMRGPIYKMNLHAAPGNWWKPLSGYPWSVSRLNHMLSLFVTTVWFVVAAGAAKDAGIGVHGHLTITSLVVLISLIAFVALPFAGMRRPHDDPKSIAFDLREYEHGDTQK
jgi:hypothetical protein